MEVINGNNMSGKVQWIDELKGYGFLLIRFGKRTFFHFSNWRGENLPQIGQTVTFSLAPAQKEGQADQAVNVTPVDEPRKATEVGGAL